MKKIVSTIAILLLFAQVFSQTKTPTGYTVKLQLRSTAGTNGSAVTYNATSGLYYTIIAGNEDYPIDVFDASGKWQTYITAGQDMRGFWYNSTNNTLEGNNTEGELYAWELNSRGIPGSNPKSLFKNVPVQNMQCVDYNFNGMIYQYYEGVVYSTGATKPGKMKKIKLAISSGEIENYNSYSMGYTGVAGYEIVLMNAATQSAAFFNKKGKFVNAVKLPEDAPAWSAFRFSYCNNMAWLYDADKRTWYGYKVF